MPPIEPKRLESNRRLTVVQILPALESGGVERGTLEVGKYLIEHGHRSIVISAGGRLVEQLQREGSEHLTWEVGRKSLFTLLRYVGRLRRFLREQQVDILHARSRVPAWVAWLAWKGMAPTRRPRFVTTVHGLYSVNAYSAVMTKGEWVIAVSETVRDYIQQNYPDVEPRRIELIYRGVDPAEYPPGYRPPDAWQAEWNSRHPQLVGKTVLTLPGRITRLKGHTGFIELIADLLAENLPVHGLIVGGAHPSKQRYLDELRKRVETLGLSDAITFTGQRGDLREIMAISDIVFSLSTQPESFGRTTLEALSLGTPVAGYAHGGVGELLADLYPAGAVKLGDRLDLKRVATRLLHHPVAPPAAHVYTLAAMLQKTIDLYLSLASNGARAPNE